MLRTSLFCILSLTAALPASAQCPANDVYGNTSRATALTLQSGYQFYSDLAIVGVDPGNYLTPSEGQDIFLLTLGEGATLQVSVDYVFSESALYGQLYRDNTATLLASTDPNTQTLSFSYTNATGGPDDVLLKITSGAAFQGCGDYELTVVSDTCPGDDAFEPNNDCLMAAFFGSTPSSELNPELQVLSSQDGDDDWFALDIMPGETLDASILFEHAIADLDLQIAGPNGTCDGVLQTSQSTTDDESVSWTNTTNSTATIGVRAYFYDSAAGNACCNYELQWEISGALPDDQFEDNDTLCTATGIPVGYFPDLRVFDADSDFFVQFVTDGEQVEYTIDFSHADGDLDLRLHDLSNGCGSGTVVANSDSVDDTESVIGVAGAGGTLFALEVLYFPNDGGHNDYDLSVARAFTGEVGGTICYGVANSTGASATIYPLGSASVSANDMLIASDFLPLNSFGFFNTSQGYGFVANPGGSSGNLCIAGAAIGRYVGSGQIQNSGTTGSVSLPIDWNTMPQPNGAISAAPGDTWYFQLWYRDANPAGPTSNFSAALRVRTEN